MKLSLGLAAGMMLHGACGGRSVDHQLGCGPDGERAASDYRPAPFCN